MKRFLLLVSNVLLYCLSLMALAKDRESYLDQCANSVLEQIYRNDSLISTGNTQDLNFVLDIRYEEYKFLEKLDGSTGYHDLNNRLKNYYNLGINTKDGSKSMAIYVILLSDQPPLAEVKHYVGEVPKEKSQLLDLYGKYDKTKYDALTKNIVDKKLPEYSSETVYDQFWRELTERVKEQLKKKESITFNNRKGAILNIINFLAPSTDPKVLKVGRKTSVMFGRSLSNEAMKAVLGQTNAYINTNASTLKFPLYNATDEAKGHINLFLKAIELGLNGIKNNQTLTDGSKGLADEDGIDADAGVIQYQSTGISKAQFELVRTKYLARWGESEPNLPKGISKVYSGYKNVTFVDHAGITTVDPSFLSRFFKDKDLSEFSVKDVMTALSTENLFFEDKVKYHIIITSTESYALNRNPIPTAIQQVIEAKPNDEYTVYIGLHVDIMEGEKIQVYTAYTNKLADKIYEYKKDLGFEWYQNKTSGRLVFAKDLKYQKDWTFKGEVYAIHPKTGEKVFNNYSEYYLLYRVSESYVKIASDLDSYLESDEFAYIFLEGYTAVLMAPLTGGMSLEAFAVKLIAQKVAKNVAAGIFSTIAGKSVVNYLIKDEVTTLKEAVIYTLKNTGAQEYANNVIDEFLEGSILPRYVNGCMGQIHEHDLEEKGYTVSDMPLSCIEGAGKVFASLVLMKGKTRMTEYIVDKIKGNPVKFWTKMAAILGDIKKDHVESFNNVFGIKVDADAIIKQIPINLSKYINLKKAYTGFQTQLGSNYTVFENALKRCNDEVLTAFDNNTALFNKLGNIKDLGETELAERMVKVSNGEDFGVLKLNNVLTKFINVSSVSIPKTVDLSSYISQSSDNLIDIVVHFQSGSYKALVEQDGKFVEKLLNTQDLAEIINKLPVDKAVRLLSCNDIASARDLSKLINNRTLYASDGWVELFQDGAINSANPFKRLVNGVETGDIGKYSNYRPDFESVILGPFLDFPTRLAKFTEYINGIDPNTLKDAETTARMLNSFLKYLDKFRDPVNDSRPIHFAVNYLDPLNSRNIERKFDDKGKLIISVLQAPAQGGNYTEIYENGGFVIFRNNMASIFKKKE